MTQGAALAAKHAGRQTSFINRLSTGTGAFNILGPRKHYYWVGIVLVVASILLIAVQGFNWGFDFVGGTRLTFQPGDPVPSNTQIADVILDSTGVTADHIQRVGTDVQVIQISMAELTAEQTAAAEEALTSAFGLVEPVAASAVSETWGEEVSRQAIISVIVFLIAVALFIWLRYDWRGSVGAVVSTVQVMIITAGVYAVIGFEVTPATVIGLLTILGFSLYDTVVVFDKVQENSKGLTSLTRRTFSEAANLAINQTLMRSINTSLIALLPVAGLLVAGVMILGSGTLKDLALVQLVGMLVGAYSSLFVAVPLAVDLRVREPTIRAHTARVAAKRKAEGIIVDADGDPISRVGVGTPDGDDEPDGPPPLTVGVSPEVAAAVAARDLQPSAAPKPGLKPVRSDRPAGKAGRPAGKAGRPTGKAGRPTGKRTR